jgi:hypothetical protein
MVWVKVLWMYLIRPLCLLTVTCTDTGRDISAKVVMAVMELLSLMTFVEFGDGNSVKIH